MGKTINYAQVKVEIKRQVNEKCLFVVALNAQPRSNWLLFIGNFSNNVASEIDILKRIYGKYTRSAFFTLFSLRRFFSCSTRLSLARALFSHSLLFPIACHTFLVSYDKWTRKVCWKLIIHNDLSIYRFKPVAKKSYIRSFSSNW